MSVLSKTAVFFLYLFLLCGCEIPFELSGEVQTIDPSQVGTKIAVGDKWPMTVNWEEKRSGKGIMTPGFTSEAVYSNAVFIEKSDGYIVDLIFEDIIAGDGHRTVSWKEKLGLTDDIMQGSVFINEKNEAIISKINVPPSVHKAWPFMEKYFERMMMRFNKKLLFRGRELTIGEKVDAKEILLFDDPLTDGLLNVDGVLISMSTDCDLSVVGVDEHQVFLHAGKGDCSALLTAHPGRVRISLKCLLDYRVNLTFGIFDYRQTVCRGKRMKEWTWARDPVGAVVMKQEVFSTIQ